MGLNKKGMFFTIAVIAIMGLFLLTYVFTSQFSERKTIQKRITTLNNFVFSIEQDLSRQLFISGFRTIFLLETEVIESGNYVTDIDQTFNQAFFNGQINGVSQPIMLGATFTDIQDAIIQKSNKMNLNITLENPNITITQTDPWNVKFSLTANLYAKDNNNLAFWNTTKTFDAFIPIENFEDPLYIINTNGRVTNKIQKTPYTEFVSGEEVVDLLNHALGPYYIESTDAPNFLQRLQGVNTGDPNGVESLINPNELSAQGISVQDKVIVDHIYFSTKSPKACNIQSLPSWFKLDEEHLELYQAIAIAYNCE